MKEIIIMKEVIIEVPDEFSKTLKPWKVKTEIKGELIRCKDCKKRNQHHECEYGYHSDDWFCGDGEPAEDAH